MSSDWYTPKASVKGNYSLPFSNTNSLTIEKEVLEKMSAYAEAHQSNAFLILHQDKIILEKYWRGASKTSTSNSMSMAKTLIGLLIGIAIDKGQINSENDLAHIYLPEWKDDERSKITIKDLLQMQSGLRNDDSVDNLNSDIIQMYVGSDVEETVLDIPSNIAPATEFDYNNANTQLLAIILERVSKTPIEEYLSKNIWQTVGANDAGWWLDDSDGMPKAFCCFFATARDWMRIGKLILDKGKWNNQQIVSEKWIDNMLNQSELEKDYGFQIWLNYEDGGRRAKDRTEPFLIKTIGIDGKSKQHVFIVEELDLIIVRIGENPDEWDESFFVNSIVRSLNHKSISLTN